MVFGLKNSSCETFGHFPKRLFEEFVLVRWIFDLIFGRILQMASSKNYSHINSLYLCYFPFRFKNQLWCNLCRLLNLRMLLKQKESFLAPVFFSIIVANSKRIKHSTLNFIKACNLKVRWNTETKYTASTLAIVLQLLFFFFWFNFV